MKNGLIQAKKVLFLVTKSNWGGAQRYVFDLATHIPKERFESLAAFGPAQGSAIEGALATKLHEAGIPTILIPELGRDIGVADTAAYGAIRQLIRTEQPEVLHLNSSKAGLLGVFAGRFSGTPRIIFTAHGWPFREDRGLLWRALAWFGSALTVALAHKTVCVSDADARAFAWLPFCSRKIVRIYNGIDLGMRFGSGEQVRSAFPAGAQITGTIGELTANKNQTALIERARIDPSLHIAMVGEGEDRSELERLIAAYGLSERVKLLGYISASEALKGFDSFALPSRKEGLPYVLIEARAAGLPIEANRTGGVGEVLDLPLKTFALDRMIEETIVQYES